ncbi:NUDIX domain-containing protein [Nocardioides sp. DS6]|uniref:NUDIX domain-containing protein n=1 Tax=Nocardioides eburneus TaxID=3231482 RepID=A0ABV3T0R8_9ACTN
MSDELTVTTVGEGVARISWEPGEPIDVVRREVAAALMTHVRVEALVDPDDTQGQRTATWSGMHREGVMRGVTIDGRPVDRIVYARLTTDVPVDEPEGFRALLNSFLPRKRAIGQMLLRDEDERVLLCQLTYKRDWDLPGGVVEVGESPRLATSREIEEELALRIPAGELVLTDWLPPWSGWDDAVCLVFDGGVHPASLTERIVHEAREIRTAEFCTIEQIRERAADFTARRIEAALAAVRGDGPRYTESGRTR